jgi:UDP-N-acetylmuramoyl-tripeptide--D-alanyl-D-alanine ligase
MDMKNQAPVFDAAAFAAWVSGEGQALPPTVCGVTQDTRKLTPGCLYVALRGERFDGHDFVEKALQGGAAAALVEQTWRPSADVSRWPLIRVADTHRALSAAARVWRQRSRAFVVGLTGSSGKTTTKEMAAALFSAGGSVCATQGNLNNEIGLPLSLLAMPEDTAFGIFETGTNHPGEIARLADVLKPRMALVSSIGRAHIEHFGSVEAIAREKGGLLAALPHDGTAVLCRETACFEVLASLSNAPVVTTSLVSREADFFGEALDAASGVLRVAERAAGEVTDLRSGLSGAHNASNLLLAFAAARSAGVPAAAAVRALENLSLPGMRWEVTDCGGVDVVNDAYNANPDSMTAALRTFVERACKGRRVVVLGDMLELGGYAEPLHREIGRRVAELAPDGLFAVGPDASRYLADEAVKAGFPASRVFCFSAVAEAAAAVKAFVRPGDGVLLKASRGMKLEGVLNELRV